LSDRQLFVAFRDYGIESIHCVADGVDARTHLTGDRSVGAGNLSVVFRRDPEFPLVYNHDQGSTVKFELTDQEHNDVRELLQSSGISQKALEGPLAPEGE
jgi:hypothetical protein